MKQIAKSLAKFHTLMGDIKKDSVNPFFKSKFAALDSILPAIKGPLAEAGLTFVQLPSHVTTFTHVSGADCHECIPSLRTIIIDVESGESIESNTPLLPTKQDSQGHGAAITYMRRFALVAALGLNTEEDDDGNSTVSHKTPQSDTEDPTVDAFTNKFKRG